MTKMRAKAVVFATGVIEQPAVFRNNDLPGVLLASGAGRLLRHYRVAPGRNVVIVAANPEAYSTRSRAALAGCASRGDRRFARPRRGCARRRPHVRRSASRFTGRPRPTRPSRARTARWRRWKSRRSSPSGRVDSAKRRRIECDAVLMSVGWAAATQLFAQAGGVTRFSEELQQFVPQDLPAGVVCGRPRERRPRFRATPRRRQAGRIASGCPRGFRRALERDRRAQYSPPFAPLPDHRPSARQELRRLRRGPAGQGSGECGARGIRFERAAQALQHGRDGALAGQALEHERVARLGARARP